MNTTQNQDKNELLLQEILNSFKQISLSGRNLYFKRIVGELAVIASTDIKRKTFDAGHGCDLIEGAGLEFVNKVNKLYGGQSGSDDIGASYEGLVN
jgi:hypothetical protein